MNRLRFQTLLHQFQLAPLHLLEIIRGRAVQVDPIKPMLKSPGIKRLKLKYDELLSSFAFKFNLRRYAVAHGMHFFVTGGMNGEVRVWDMRTVGRCRLTL